jgi:pilus assembly protein Flp/PilA
VSTVLLRVFVWLQSQVVAARSEERGQGLVEYALIIALIAILVIGAILALKTQIVGIFDHIGNCLQNNGSC